MKDGHLNSCKECRKAYQQSRPYDKERERKRNQTEKRNAYHAANLKRWRRENPQELAVQLARRRVRKLNAEGDFTVEEFEALCEKYGNVCLRCGDREAQLTPDRVVPLSRAQVVTEQHRPSERKATTDNPRESIREIPGAVARVGGRVLLARNRGCESVLY
jgi:hypothetical protein